MTRWMSCTCRKDPAASTGLELMSWARDMLSRCIYGARITLPIAIFTVIVAILLGGTLGTLCAYFGGQFDNIVMRFIDIWGSIPGLMLSIAIVAALGNNMSVLVIGLAVGAVPNMTRTFRGAIFTVVDSDYVESSKSMGASSFNIMFKHLLPNAVGPVILAIVGLLGVEVLCVSTLSFLGVCQASHAGVGLPYCPPVRDT